MPIWMMPLIKLYEGVLWAFRNPRIALELALVAALLFVGWRYNRTQDALSRAKLEAGQLEDGLKQQIKLVNGQLEVLKREGGRTTVERRYVPPEGSVVIKQKDLDELHKKYHDLMEKLAGATTAEERASLKKEIERLMGQLKQPDTEIVVKDKGFTLKPGFGIQWAGSGLGPRLDLKMLYFKRYSLLIGGGADGVDASVSRHLDDVLWWHPQNIEAFGGYQFLKISGNNRIVLGIRSNF